MLARVVQRFALLRVCRTTSAQFILKTHDCVNKLRMMSFLQRVQLNEGESRPADGTRRAPALTCQATKLDCDTNPTNPEGGGSTTHLPDKNVKSVNSFGEFASLYEVWYW